MAGVDTVVLISIDGLRPDGLDQAETPRLDRLRTGGAYTATAQTIMPSVTLPCHASMFLSVPAGRHGITTNTWMPQVRPVQGLLDAAKAAGKRTAAFYNWEQLRDLSRPGALDLSLMHRDCHSEHSDIVLAQETARRLDEPFGLMFLYLGHPDAAGHDHGWMSPQYLDAVANADQAVGIVLAALGERLARTAVLVTADHGGHERSHGTDCPEDMTIPFLLHLPNGSQPTLPDDVSILDVAPTVAGLLGVPRPEEWEGRALAS